MKPKTIINLYFSWQTYSSKNS